ncbi:hypothetical protein [Mesorhizobium sp. M0213]|uniref:hypothetical protein n=1 Tax=unclassified Mesorhizobium TaxID=325217 RepID=UPI003336ADA1
MKNRLPECPGDRRVQGYRNSGSAGADAGVEEPGKKGLVGAVRDTDPEICTDEIFALPPFLRPIVIAGQP